MELISRDKLKEVIEPMVGKFDNDGEFWWTRESILRVIDNAPTVEERKEGTWIDHSNEGYVECPFCGSCTTCEDNIDELHFCFNCGNKLKGE